MHTYINFRSVMLLQAFTAALLLMACTASSPRFTTKDADAPEKESGRSRTEKKASGSGSTGSGSASRTGKSGSGTLAAKTGKAIRPAGEVGPASSSHASIPADELDDTPPGISRDKLLLDVLSFLGVPYRYGGTTRAGIDCSAFTAQIYSDATSVQLPRSTIDQWSQGKEVSRDELRFGDLVFFRTNGRQVSHVGIFIEDGLFVHASTSDGVSFSSLESDYFKKRFAGARRVLAETE